VTGRFSKAMLGPLGVPGARRGDGGKDSMTSDVSLEFLVDGKVLFSSAGRWLHPLFDLERFLRGRDVEVSRAMINDKVVGRGSAFLIVRLGVRRIHAGVLSRLGKDVLDRAGAACTWDSLVEEIECRTEGILREVTDTEEAYRILAERVRMAAQRDPAQPTGERRP
jgi:hypothetical protein